MHTNTVYGTWATYTRDALTPEATLEDALINAESEWRERIEETGAFEKMAEDYRDAINNALPDGVTLSGEQFYGPAYIKDYTWQEELDIAEIINSIDVQKIIDTHDPDR